MNTALGTLPWTGGLLLALGLVALARGRARRTVLSACLPGLALLGVHGVEDRDILLLAGLALAGLALLAARPSSPPRTSQTPPPPDRR